MRGALETIITFSEQLLIIHLVPKYFIDWGMWTNTRRTQKCFRTDLRDR